MVGLAAAGISAGVNIIGGLIGSRRARKEQRAAQRRARALEANITKFENNRQDVIDPYAGVKDMSSIATDLSGMVSNPYANLGVATGAAEMQAEQTDVALANTLDSLQQTGASAGGATALAQAALQSKKGIAANIEQQEAQNEKLRAQGEQQMQQVKMSEQQRLQGVQLSEAQRVQQARAQGSAFQFNAQERRDEAKLDNLYSQLQGQQNNAAAARSAQGAAMGGMMSALGNIGGALIGAQN